jgi:L-proline amide hydrolase
LQSETREGHTPFREHRTWFRVTGALNDEKPPLVLLHGGPGAAHNYLDRYDLLASQGRAVVQYDQIGVGRSTHLPDAPKDFWTVQLFVDEFNNLIDHLGIATRFHLLGQSWGGMLAAEIAVRQPPGLRALVIANSPASMQLWVQEANRLRADLPPDVQATLLRHEAAGTTESEEYNAAVRVFYDRHLCRVPWPPELETTFAAIAEDPTVYHTMNGPSEFHVIGTIRDWSIIDRLDRIAVPTLLISGRHDEATPAVVQPFADRIRDAHWTVFEHSSHLPHIEETERVMQVVGDFLADHDVR